MPEFTQEQRKAFKQMNENAFVYNAATVSEEEINRYNSGEMNEQEAQSVAIRLKDMMMIDTENGSVLKEIYQNIADSANAELEKTEEVSNYSGLKKMFNSKEKEDAQKKKRKILNDRVHLEEMKQYKDNYKRFLTEINRYGKDEIVRLGNDINAFDEYRKNALLEAIQNNEYDNDKFRILYLVNRYKEFRSTEEEAPQVDYRWIVRINSEWKEGAYEFFCRSERFSEEYDASARDMMGYASKAGDLREIDNEQVRIRLNNHSKMFKGLKLASEEGNEMVTCSVEESVEAMKDEMKYLHTQAIDMAHFCREHSQLFASELPSYSTTKKYKNTITSLVKKMQMSLIIAKNIYLSNLYNHENMEATAEDKALKEQFEKETFVYIIAMHSHMFTLKAIMAEGDTLDTSEAHQASEDEKRVAWADLVADVKAADLAKRYNRKPGGQDFIAEYNRSVARGRRVRANINN